MSKLKEFALFLGCLIPYHFPEMEVAARKVFNKYDYGFKEMEGVGCCPDPVALQSADLLTWCSLAARNISIAQEMDLDILTLCSGCYETFKTVKYHLEHDEKLFDKVNEVLGQIGREYTGKTEIYHSFEIIYNEIGKERIKKDIVKELTGLRVGIHYGCHLVKPSKIMQMDNPEDPQKLDEMITLLGATSVQYEGKMDCCGSVVTRTREELGYEMGKNKLLTIHDRGVDCMALVCPCCYQQFDWRQPLIKRRYPEEITFEIPILSYEELLALAIGFKPEELGFKFHRVKAKEVIEKIYGDA
ncbi:MAG: CoB--CoM heterodisulfide reductase subunit B [Candidatus Lokiarchaeota archaeon]|nr:CoB--CoM heterodisulfide reductase subunit B [Candidatus Lokiarchaeota archaeon]